MAEKDEPTEYLEVFRTGKLWEFDRGRDALKEHNVPFFAQTQTLSGVQTALDAAPTMGPGVAWALLVPSEAAQQARQILQECHLDVGKQPEAWDFGPQRRVQRYWKMYIWGALILIALLFVVEIFLRNR